MGALELITYPAVRSILYSGFALSFLSMAFEVVFILYSYSKPELGGLGRSHTQIGYALAGTGVVGAMMSLIIFPPLQRTFNNRQMYATLMALWPATFLSMPLLNILVRSSASGGMVWVGIGALLVPVRFAALSSPLNMILVKASAPIPGALGGLFGLQQTFSCLARAVGPAFSSSLFAISVENNLLSGYLVWFVLAACGLVGVYCAANVFDVEEESRKGKGKGKAGSA